MGVDRDRLVDVCASLPIFPLPGVVLMPGMVMPLHVFEPRYRELVDYVSERTQMFGLATLNEEGVAGARPAIHPEIGVGMIVGSQSLPDGRKNLLLQHVCVARLVEELPSPFGFRMVQSELMPPLAPAEAALRRLRIMVLQLGAVSPAAEQEAAALGQLRGDELVDGLARRVLGDERSQRAYLTASRERRVHMVEQRLASFLAVGEARAEA